MPMTFLIYLLILPWLILANTEKIIFVPHSDNLSQQASTALNDLQILRLDKDHKSVRDKIPVEFATEKRPFGKQSWYLLEGLEEGRRYEIRVCWAAIVNTFA